MNEVVTSGYAQVVEEPKSAEQIEAELAVQAELKAAELRKRWLGSESWWAFNKSRLLAQWKNGKFKHLKSPQRGY